MTGLLLIACKKEVPPMLDFGPNGGITERNTTGQLTGAVDASDWTHDDNWTTQEQALFGPLFNAFQQGDDPWWSKRNFIFQFLYLLSDTFILCFL